MRLSSSPTTITLLAFSVFSLATASPEPEPQIAQGGGVAAATLAAVQYPVVTNVASLQTINGVTTVVQIVFTQTFAATPLGTWAFPTPGVGSVGLGDIQGTVGSVKSKRGMPTPEARS